MKQKFMSIHLLVSKNLPFNGSPFGLALEQINWRFLIVSPLPKVN